MYSDHKRQVLLYRISLHRATENAGGGWYSERAQDAADHGEFTHARVAAAQQGMGRSLPGEGPERLQGGGRWIL